MVELHEPQNVGVASKIAIAGHPVHAMLVTFPISLVVATLGADIFWWLTADHFFARVGLWTSGWGFGMGVLAAVAGTAELLAGRGVRHKPESWTHAVAGMMLLATIGANWGFRLLNPEEAILPWGAVLSLGGLLFVGLTGWKGGKLVFEHQVGVMIGDEEKAKKIREEEEEELAPDLPEVAAGQARAPTSAGNR